MRLQKTLLILGSMMFIAPGALGEIIYFSFGEYIAGCIPRAQGKVLEIDAGSGANFPCYDATRVSKLYALEPNLGTIGSAQKQQSRTKLNIESMEHP